MRSILALTAAGLVGGSLIAAGPASAQTTVIERDAPPRAVVIERDEPPVVVERRVVPVERQGGCETKTVTRTEDDGTSTTVRRERCD